MTGTSTLVSSVQSILAAEIRQNNFELIMRRDNKLEWNKFWDCLEYQDVISSNEWINYQSEYFYGNDEGLTDFSFCLLGKDGSRLARFNLSIFISNTACEINSSGLPISPPNFTFDATHNEKKKNMLFHLKNNCESW